MNFWTRKVRAKWGRRRLWEARVACLLFGVLALSHGAMAVAAVFEERPFAGLVMAAAAAVFYGLTVCAWRDVARAG
jgi:hypothetical protein